MKITRLDHLVLTVRDIPRTVAGRAWKGRYRGQRQNQGIAKSGANRYSGPRIPRDAFEGERNV